MGGASPYRPLFLHLIKLQKVFFVNELLVHGELYSRQRKPFLTPHLQNSFLFLFNNFWNSSFPLQVAPCANDTKINFLWTVTCSDATAQRNVEESSSFQFTKEKATVSITKGVLTADVTCTFNLTGRMNYNPSIRSSIAVDIKALPTPLESAISGGRVKLKRDFIEERLPN